jgi:predicted permease
MQHRLAALFRTLFRSRQLESELSEELEAYVAERIDRHRARGLSAAAARRLALGEVGGIEQTKEQVRDVRMGAGIETTLRDLRYGCRMIARAPGFSIIVVLTLALVIGANATVFSVMHAVLWRDLPYPDADRLVIVDADARGVTSAGLTGRETIDIHAEPGLFDALATIVRVDAHLTDGQYERVKAASTTDEAFRAFGALPLAYGRPLEAKRDHGSDGYVRSVVISYDLWRTRFQADPNAVGRHIEVNNLEVEIVGVLRPDFRLFVPAAAALPEIVDVWFPRAFDTDDRTRGQLTVARIAPGVSVADAQARVEAIGRRFLLQHPAAYEPGTFRLYLRPLHDVLTSDARPALWALAGAVWFVLVIGCVNIANLMLARARTRAPETEMRRALGASRLRLVRQFLAEAAVLAITGAIIGLLLAYGGVALVEWLRPAHLPRQSQIAVNGAVVAFTAVLAVIVSVVFGLVPALAGSSGSSSDSLRAGRGSVQRRGRRRLQRSLVIAEVALSIVPLVAAGLMLRTFVNLLNAPIGFDPTGMLTAKMAYSARLLSDPKERLRLHEQAIDGVARLSGVQRVSAASPLPFDEYQFTLPYGVGGDTAALNARATIQSVFPGYLAMMGIQLRSGRDFSTDDLRHNRPVVIIDERIAARLWPHGAIGQRLAVLRSRKPVLLEVIGVTNPVRVTRVRDDALPHLFLPFDFYGLQMALVVQTDRDASSIGPEIKSLVESLGTRRPVFDIRPMHDYVDGSIADSRFTMLVLVGFAVAAILLAAIGLYGTLAYLTFERTQEFGVRMALGASTQRIIASVAGEGLWLTSIGASAGLVGAGALGSSLQGLLYGVTPFDRTTIVAVAVVVAVVALIAVVHPAWRAGRVDPCTALRAE